MGRWAAVLLAYLLPQVWGANAYALSSWNQDVVESFSGVVPVYGIVLRFHPTQHLPAIVADLFYDKTGHNLNYYVLSSQGRWESELVAQHAGLDPLVNFEFAPSTSVPTIVYGGTESIEWEDGKTYAVVQERYATFHQGRWSVQRINPTRNTQYFPSVFFDVHTARPVVLYNNKTLAVSKQDKFGWIHEEVVLENLGGLMSRPWVGSVAGVVWKGILTLVFLVESGGTGVFIAQKNGGRWMAQEIYRVSGTQARAVAAAVDLQGQLWIEANIAGQIIVLEPSRSTWTARILAHRSFQETADPIDLEFHPVSGNASTAYVVTGERTFTVTLSKRANANWESDVVAVIPRKPAQGFPYVSFAFEPVTNRPCVAYNDPDRRALIYACKQSG